MDGDLCGQFQKGQESIIKTVSYVIVSYSLFFQSVNAINLRFKGQHNWLSKLNRFYFIYWSLVSGPITIHIQTTNQKYEK